MSRFLVVLALVVGGLFSSGCASVSLSRQDWTREKISAPDKILVRPFTVDRVNFRVDREGNVLEEFEEEFSGDFARRLAERLSKHVVPASVVERDEKITDPRSWVVEGHFKRVHQGSRALRMLVGFGLGASKTETRVEIFQPSGKRGMVRIAELETTGGSNAEPGALFSSPFGAGPRLITLATTSGLAADARRTARMITAAISEKLHAQGADLAGPPLRSKPLGGFPEKPAAKNP